MFLFLGLGCLVFQPLALQYGKRPVYLFSMLATTMICVWPPYTKTNGEWIASKILQGLFGATIESLPEISMSDLFFEHERSLGLSLYGLTLLAASYLAPVLAGFISQGQGWEWVMWWCSIFGAVCFVLLFFLMEETNYERKVKIDSTTNKPITMDSHQGVVSGIFSNTNQIDAAMDSSSSQVEKNEIQLDIADKNQLTSVASAENANIHNQTSNVEVVDLDSYVPQKTTTRTFREKLSLFNGAKKKFLLHHYAIAPFYMARFPVVLWAGFLYGSSLVWFNVLNATAALILSGTPVSYTHLLSSNPSRKKP